ncbi:ATP-grasp domain-containing protein [Bosea sp. 117]|uniref:ATP-grasp domain-containing protein n=1 Tax=Bosea sp. 117 TaxID=1125973 RepID=UPI00049436B4|nr:ATP-grasp domain-containing protein [Bosea sp. 117]
MPSLSPDRWSPHEPPDLVIVGIAARALAAAARRAGMRPIVLDLFGDDDTRALAHEAIPIRRLGGLAFDPDDLFEQLAIHATGDLPVVLGTGFEQSPELVERIGHDFRLVGNGSRTLAFLKEPVVFMRLTANLGIPYPTVFTGPAPEGVRTLEKRVGGSGGWHVREAQAPRGPGWYVQEYVEGDTFSALFLGNGREARLLAFSQQWCAPTDEAPFRYGGAAGPVAIDAATRAGISTALDRLVYATGLVGLASADLVRTETGWTLLEINPRPGATLDVFDHEPLPPLLTLHFAACEGRLPDLAPLEPADVETARAAAVFYAPAPFEMRLDPLPDWVADRPPQGTRIETGEPVCTVLAEGRTAEEARETVAQRISELWQALSRAGRKAAE